MLIKIDINEMLQPLADASVKEYNDPTSWDDPEAKIADAEPFQAEIALNSVIEYVRNTGSINDAREDIFGDFYTADDPDEECMVNFGDHFLGEVKEILEGINVRQFDLKLLDGNVYIDTDGDVIANEEII